MKGSPLVSFLISAYNEELYVEQCITSCLDQTYPYLEVVIVDDGSTDRTSQIIRSSFQNDPRIKIVALKQNSGKINGFNTAFAASKGEYVAFMGADDICYPRRIELSLKAISERCGMVCTDLDKIDSNGGIIERNIVNTLHGKLDKEHLSPKSLIEKPKVYGGTIFLARSIANKIFPLNIQMSHEDWFIPIKASLYTQIRYINEPLIAYRLHANNSSSNSQRIFFGYKKWLHLNTRNIAFYRDISELIQKHAIECDADWVKFNLARSLLLKRGGHLKAYLENLPQVQRLGRKVLYTLHLFPYLVYFLVMLLRLKRNCVKKLKKFSNPAG